MRTILALALILISTPAWAQNYYTGRQGWNSSTGSQWLSGQGNGLGSVTGTDKSGGNWRYNSGTGYYSNSQTGRICSGKGTNRVCN